jgi:hypothetical protein
MTDAQKLVIASLVVIGLVLAYNMLDWTSQFGHDDWTPIVIFYGTYDPLWTYRVLGSLRAARRDRRHLWRGCAALSLWGGSIHGHPVELKYRAEVVSRHLTERRALAIRLWTPTRGGGQEMTPSTPQRVEADGFRELCL